MLKAGVAENLTEGAAVFVFDSQAQVFHST
jgi:hypothetical protein